MYCKLFHFFLIDEFLRSSNSQMKIVLLVITVNNSASSIESNTYLVAINKIHFDVYFISINMEIQGDIIVGPFICHGLESENESLFKTVNKQQKFGADEISKWNVTAAIHELHNKNRYEKEKTPDQATLEEINEVSSKMNSPKTRLRGTPYSKTLFEFILF